MQWDGTRTVHIHVDEVGQVDGACWCLVALLVEVVQRTILDNAPALLAAF